jgi:hypothetical protein
VRQQAVPAADVDHAAATKHTAHPPCHFPGFVQFLSRNAAGRANGSAQPVEQGASGEPAEVVTRETVA